MKRAFILLIIAVFVMSLGTALAADRKSEEAKGPLDTFLFQPFYILDKAMVPPDNYEEQFHKTIEQSMQEDHLKAKAKRGR